MEVTVMSPASPGGSLPESLRVQFLPMGQAGVYLERCGQVLARPGVHLSVSQASGKHKRAWHS